MKRNWKDRGFSPCKRMTVRQNENILQINVIL